MAKAKRNYKSEYRKYQSSAKRRKYRAELNKRARKMKVYGKRKAMGKDLVHKGGRIVGLGSRKKNRAAGGRLAARIRKRRNKSRKKK